MTGRTIAHFEVLEKLGEGGMGVVYKARDTHLDRLVAIKVLPAEKVADPERKRRFIQEAKAASARDTSRVPATQNRTAAGRPRTWRSPHNRDVPPHLLRIMLSNAHSLVG